MSLDTHVGDGHKPSVRAVQYLLDMDSDEFRKLVDRDIRNRTERHEAKALRATPLVVERWYQMLVGMKVEVEGTLGARKAETKALRHQAELSGDKAQAVQIMADYNKWKAGAMRFSTGLYERLAEAKFVRLQLVGDPLSQSQQAIVNLRNRVAQLEDAIARHRAAMEALGEDPSDSDERLWDFLAG